MGWGLRDERDGQWDVLRGGEIKKRGDSEGTEECKEGSRDEGRCEGMMRAGTRAR